MIRICQTEDCQEAAKVRELILQTVNPRDLSFKHYPILCDECWDKFSKKVREIKV